MYLTPDDLQGIDPPTATQLIEDVEARAKAVAPCLKTPNLFDADQSALVKAILRGIVERWAAVGAGSVNSSMHVAGPITIQESIDTRRGVGRTLWKSEITDLQELCRQVNKSPDNSRAFSIDQIAWSVSGNHQPWCSITWGAWCSCGADLTRGEYPLWEGGLLS